jgi:hypothetical protein
MWGILFTEDILTKVGVDRLNSIPTLEGSDGYHTSGEGYLGMHFGISDSYSCAPLQTDLPIRAIQQVI